MKKYSLIVVFPFFFFIPDFAQQVEPFKPNGGPEIRIFSNFTSSFSDGKNFNKFDITRAYFGYIYNFSRTLTGRVTVDFGNPSAGKFNYTALLRFAYLQYHTENLTLTGGMFYTPQYDIADKRWGYRYIFRNSHDEYGFGPGADIGLYAVYNFSPSVSADLILVNGEGYKLAEADSVFRSGLGITYNLTKSLWFRGYYDTMKKNGNNQQTIECIFSYEDRKFNLTAFFNHQLNHAMVAGQDYTGLSFNGSLFLRNNMKLFARFDDVFSAMIGSSPKPWNNQKDGKLYLAGIEFLLTPGVKLAPNFQGWEPADADLHLISRFVLNAEIRL
jgi:hypothetical protein